VSFLRNLGSDLVEKRLWPIALALILAIVAVPMLLSGGSEPAPAPSTPAAAPSTPAAASAQAQVSLDSAVPGKRGDKSTVRNPFKQQHAPKKATDASASSTPSAPTSAGDTKSGGSGTPVTVSPKATKPVSQPKQKLSTAFYRVALRFGEAGDQRTLHDVARLTPLPSSTDPFFVFLGVLADGKTAVFLGSSDATATGDGKCRPSASNCQTIEMKAGDSEYFDLPTGTAGVVQYKLDLVKIVKRTAHSTAVAASKRARESKAGREALRAAIAQDEPGSTSYLFDRAGGVLVPKTG
jgi:hypothetical protein